MPSRNVSTHVPAYLQMQQRGASEDMDGNVGLAASLGGRRWFVRASGGGDCAAGVCVGMCVR